MKLVLDRATPVEREDEHERAGASTQLSKRSGDVAGQSVDHKEEPLGVAEDIIGPLERGVGERRRRRSKEQPAIVSAREPPQGHAGGAEAELDGCLIESGQLAAE